MTTSLLRYSGPVLLPDRPGARHRQGWADAEPAPATCQSGPRTLRPTCCLRCRIRSKWPKMPVLRRSTANFAVTCAELLFNGANSDETTLDSSYLSWPILHRLRAGVRRHCNHLPPSDLATSKRTNAILDDAIVDDLVGANFLTNAASQVPMDDNQQDARIAGTFVGNPD